MAVKKYFIALVLPEPILTQVEGLKQSLFEKYHLKGALRSPAHITLHRPFEWKEEKEGLLISTLKAFSFEQSFEVELKNYAFFEPRVIYIDVVANEVLNKLHYNLMRFAQTNLKLFNEVEDKRGFHPHVTVAFRDLKKPLFYELQKEFQKELFGGKFQTSAMQLLRLEEKWVTIANVPLA